MSREPVSYESKARLEAIHWGSYTAEALKRGIPTWVDVRNATPLGGFAHIFGDPETERVLRGKYKEELIEFVSSKSGWVLDIGCGAGWLSLELARLGLKVHGVDISPGQIEAARSYLKSIQEREQQQYRVVYELADLNCISLEPDKYAAIVSWDSLHHIQNLEKLFGEVRRSMQHSGLILCFEHVGSPLQKVREFAARLLRKRASPFEDIGARELVGAFHRHFDVLRSERVLPFACFVAQALGLYGWPVGKAGLLRAIRSADWLFQRWGVLPGEYAILYGTRS